MRALAITARSVTWVDENSAGRVLIRSVYPSPSEAMTPMSRRWRKSDELLHFAAELGGEDGSDAREFHEKKTWSARKKATRKGEQLCAQIRCALHLALAGCADDVLRAGSVVSVEPAPHTGRLLVLVSAGETDRAALEAALTRATGFLRTEAAAAICRRHAPELVFEVL